MNVFVAVIISLTVNTVKCVDLCRNEIRIQIDLWSLFRFHVFDAALRIG